MGDYYVYAYLDPRKPGNYIYGDYWFEYEPFYIGQGKGRRIKVHLKKVINNNFKVSNHKNNKIKSILKIGLSPIIIKIKSDLSRIEACKLESELITLIGKLIDDTGPLANTINEHPYLKSGNYENFYKHPESVKEKISHVQLNRSPEVKAGIALKKSNSMKLVPRTKEWCDRIGNANRGKLVSIETRNKISKLKKGTKLSESTKEKIRKKLEGIPRPQEVIDKIKLQKGWKQSEASRNKMKEGKEKNMPEIKITNMHTGEIIRIKKIKEFCKDNGLNKSTFRKSLKSDSIYKNYKIEYSE